MKKRENIRKVALLCVILLLVLGIVYGGLRILESTVFFRDQEQAGTIARSKTITHNGVQYFPRQDIDVVLLMGIDQTGPAAPSESYNNHGLADAIFLIVLDPKTEECRVLNLNRDTMAEIPVLGINGRPAGSIQAQLALSHTYGSGMEDSCENTRQAVSNLLGGIAIDHYIAMNVDAVAIANDAVGGVTVNVVDDFSEVDASIPMGDVTLKGDQALRYVQSRGNVSDQMNLSRMGRQEEYAKRFLEAFRQQYRSGGSDFLLKTYDAVAPYLVSDLSFKTLQTMVSHYIDYPLAEMISLEGENRLGDEFYEFYPDEAKLEAIRLELFYAPK